MGHGHAKLAGILATIGALVSATNAQAASVAFTCQQDGDTLHLAYDGAATGTLAVSGSWGSFQLAARLAGEVGSDNYGVNAHGPATLAMPDKGALEQCLAAKAQPGDLDDRDALGFLVNGCWRGIAAGPAVPVTVTVELAALDGEITADVSRQYVDTSKVAGDHIAIAEFPPMQCTTP